VIREVQREKLGRVIASESVEQFVADSMWYPDYPTYQRTVAQPAT